MKICPQCSAEYEAELKFCPRDGATLYAVGGDAELVGEVVADRYHVLQKLGQGGMGQVYLAEHVRMGRRCAIKVMNSTMMHDADAIGRFNREASNAARITHPNVAAIYDFGETREGLIYLAMEFVDGVPLTALLQREGPLRAPRAAEIARQTADALSAAHDLGIVHRDLKPDNIMITRSRDGADCVKVVDFGIAKAPQSEGQRVTKTGLVVGTPEFMSPEQLSGDHLDGRSDVYALGLVVFNMLTGAQPFPSDTVQEAMIKRLTEQPLTLAEITGASGWPSTLQLVIDRALARDRDKRYQTARDFARDLTEAVSGMAEDAPRPGAPLHSGDLPPTRVRGGVGLAAADAIAPAAGRSRSVLLPAGIGSAVLVAGLAAWFVAGTAGKGERVDSAIGGRADTTAVASAPPDTGVTAQPASNELMGRETRQLPTDAAAATTGRRPVARDRASVPASGERDARRAGPPADLDGELRRASRDALAKRPQLAIVSIRGILPRLRTRPDSVKALYGLAEALLATDSSEGLTEGCSILRGIKNDPGGHQTSVAVLLTQCEN